MPLVAFMKDTDPNRISTITPDETDRQRARKLVPARESIPGANVYDKLVVADCLTHIGGVSVPVELRVRGSSPGEWESIGIARACPLCWRILVGVDGTKEPEVKPLDHTGTHRTRKPKPPRRTKTKLPVAVDVHLDKVNFPSLKERMPKGEWFDVYQVMEEYNISRASASETLGQLRKMGLIEVIPGRGRGNKTVYRIPQEKEA